MSARRSPPGISLSSACCRVERVAGDKGGVAGDEKMVTFVPILREASASNIGHVSSYPRHSDRHTFFIVSASTTTRMDTDRWRGSPPARAERRTSTLCILPRENGIEVQVGSLPAKGETVVKLLNYLGSGIFLFCIAALFGWLLLAQEHALVLSWVYLFVGFGLAMLILLVVLALTRRRSNIYNSHLSRRQHDRIDRD